MKNGPRLFGHPVHAMLTHLPIGLLMTSPAWEVLGLLRGGPTWWTVGFWVTVAGVASSLLAAATGLLDFAALPQGHRSVERASRHMMLMMAAVCAFVANLVLRAGAAEPVGAARVAAPVCGAVGLLLLTLGGWYGGELVFRDGVGRTPEDAAPPTDEDRDAAPPDPLPRVDPRGR